MKRIKWVCRLSIALFLMTIVAMANGDTNIDGGGGSTGDGDVAGGSFWNVGDDGVRVTVTDIRYEPKPVCTLDFSNKSPTVDFYFGLKSKLYYKGNNLSLQIGTSYSASNPEAPLPQIITASGGANIAAVKRYFGQEGTLKDIADQAGFDYDRLISGDYVLLLEPVIYLKFDGQAMAMTATEAALYNRVMDGEVKSKLGYATHQNLPLAMFLETSDLGYPAWSGPRTGIRTDSQIISSLGLGTVRFKEGGVIPELPQDPATPTYDYRTDTDVITTIVVRNSSDEDINPDDNAEVIFDIGGTRYRKPFVTPPNEDTPIWIRWHTPETPQTITISVSSSHGSVIDPSVVCRVATLTENTPPDPRPSDKAPYGYTVPMRPNGTGKTSLSWGEWIPRWRADWVWVEDMEWVDGSHNSGCSPDCDSSHGEWEDNGSYEDKGWWEYDWRSYSASLSVTTKIEPAPEVPTAKLLSTGVWDMKSGYGIQTKVVSSVSTTGKSSDVTVAQNAVSYFPEFNYEEYFRVLNCTKSGFQSNFAFAYNKYSFMGAAVHYTPLWYPDRSEYAPKITVFDVWTPGGQLYYSDSDYLNINGDCYDDWNVSPVRN
ncbi:MAG: hypothetical protein RSF82_06985 [Angelakisella sp.]